jgi:hypothetical protein
MSSHPKAQDLEATRRRNRATHAQRYARRGFASFSFCEKQIGRDDAILMIMPNFYNFETYYVFSPGPIIHSFLFKIEFSPQSRRGRREVFFYLAVRGRQIKGPLSCRSTHFRQSYGH